MRFLCLWRRVDRARWIVALTEHKQAGVVTCRDGKSHALFTKGVVLRVLSLISF